jgi:hypothetical protein
MKFQPICEGLVCQRHPDDPSPVTAGPRLAVTHDEVVCTYMVQSKLGINDFVPFISRSTDIGITWSDEGPVWPHLSGTLSLFGSVSRSPDGLLYMYGISTPIDEPGELFWSDETQGMKQNQLFWSVSKDDGRSWTDPALIAMPIPGSAEAPGPLCVTSSERWVVCYSPYNTFDRGLPVDRQQVVSMFSDDEGAAWQHTSMHRFDEAESGGAEAWVIELSDGRLLSTSWQVDHRGEQDYPNAFALSHDAGESWSPTRSTGILGQSTSLMALPDGRALFVYNQRKHGEVGVWMAEVQPTQEEFGILSNQIVWRAETATQTESSGEHSEWRDFSFGEPAAAILPDGSLLLVFWKIQPGEQGIGYLKIALETDA